MLYNTEPTELRTIPSGFKQPLPQWGEDIVDFLAPRIMMEADQIIPFFFSSGNRKGRKKLFELSRIGYLKRYEISTSESFFIAYTQGYEGMRRTRILVPEINIIKAQELIIANAFCITNNISKFRFWVDKGLLIGEVTVNGEKYSLWCPRQPESRITSLKAEISLSSHGLIVVAPTLRFIYSIAKELKDLNLPIYFTTDNLLGEFMYLAEGVLTPIK